ncbi:DNA-directed RNA polymerases IV and V subunit 4 isoform X2 [Ricinus communis]|uniref:DNA-directed RNA polymerases IV and V subunit 4 isoform X2 n=1 Tax=Ricinus communis TaxID=3988 RepID=UPI0007723161|nr:DNA-directed RNA polymerases IV and V subunit 4 isoform X2 [Ricinus communis]|eukprot:XP_015578354.1 DNA-directed RNA polymerases IV and V subunit 4 isoform X2 [Ricinus communis]
MEKGGKGFSLPGKGLKSSLKSITPASTKGKDDTSAKSKRGKKVQFNSQGVNDKFNFLPKSDGKFVAATKGNMSKGGKGDKVSNGVKISSTKEPQPLELKIEQDLPKNAKCLMDCEAAQVLQGIQEQMVLLSRDPTIKLPVSFDRALQHARTGARFTNPQSVRRILEGLKKHGVSEGEICTIANVCPDGVDEVFALVPSLKSKKNVLREPLKDILGQLSELKQQA